MSKAVTDIRVKIATDLAQQFIDSGLTYTCAAAVINFCRPIALEHGKQLLCSGINFSKSRYSFDLASKMADMLAMQAVKIVHAHFYPEVVL